MQPKIVIETQYFPTIAFYSYAVNSEMILVEKWENYQKGSFRNRCQIMSSQGPLTLSIPLLSGKNEQLNIQEVKIDNNTSWKKTHLRSISSCYGNSPYFEFYFDILDQTLSKNWDSLFLLNLELINVISQILKIENKVLTTEEYVKSPENNICDLRNFISPKKSKKNQLGRDFDFIPYEQVFSETQAFEANLSILDVLFCKGPEAFSYLKNIYRK